MHKNNVNLMGRVSYIREQPIPDSEKSVTKIGLMETESWKHPETGERQERTRKHNLEAWNGCGDLFRKICKVGDLVDIEGKLIYNTYTKEGQEHTVAIIRVKDFIFLSRPDKNKEPRNESGDPE